MVQEIGPRGQGTVGYRIRRGNVLGLQAMPWQSSLTPFGSVRIVFDDGTEDDLYFDPSVVTTAGTEFVAATRPAKKDGYVLSGAVGLRATGFPARAVTAYGQMFIFTDANASQVVACIGQGPLGLRDTVTVGQFPENGYKPLFVFQGTVTEDATAGTHVTSLTVSPGAGNAFQVVGGRILGGNTATAQTVLIDVNDGTNLVVRYMSITDTAALIERNFPYQGSLTANANNFASAVGGTPIIVSGTMNLVLKVSTTAVSVVHTYSVALLLKNGVPSTTLADTVGTPTLLTNTSGVF